MNYCVIGATMMSVLLTACGEDGVIVNNREGESVSPTDTQIENTQASTAETTEYRYYGNIGVQERIEFNGLFFSGFFADYPDGYPLLAELVAVDMCSVTVPGQSNVPQQSTETSERVEFSIDTISAGEVIPFSTAAGSLFDLPRIVDGENISYLGLSTTQVPGPAPASITFDIPGDEYPAFPNITVQLAESLVVTSPASDTNITPTTTFSWTAGTNANAYITFVATNAEQTSVVVCNMRDDGAFTFPQDIRNQMGADYISAFHNIKRTLTSIRTNGNVILEFNSSSSR